MRHHRLASAIRIAPALAAAAAAPAGAQPREPGYFGPHMWADGWHGWFFGPVFMMLCAAAIVVLLVLLTRWFGGAGRGDAADGPRARGPLDMLKERVARGEIDQAEFETRRKVLSE